MLCMYVCTVSTVCTVCMNVCVYMRMYVYTVCTYVHVLYALASSNNICECSLYYVYVGLWSCTGTYLKATNFNRY